MRIGLVYDVFEDYPWRDGDPSDADAEYEPEETVGVLVSTIRRMGHVPVRIGTAQDLRTRLGVGVDIDVALNIAEGARSRNREAYAPILLEMAGVPCLGSDALTLSLTLDKAWTKDLVAAAGVPTPAYRTYRTPDAIDPDDLPADFPLFVKPRYEGSSKGITADSRVETLDALRERVAVITDTYQQDALVESFVSGGGEYTVAVVGNDDPRALPVLQRAVEMTTGIGLHALEHRGEPEADWRYGLEAELADDMEATLHADALRVYRKFDCKDFARADFRVDEDGQLWFLEMNPLPTFAPDGTFAIIAELMNQPYEEFLAGVFADGMQRLGLVPTAPSNGQQA